MVRKVNCAPEAVDMVDGLPLGVTPRFPSSSGDGREQLLDVLRAGGLRFRAGARWRATR
ncbi:hypothetical protein JNW91_17830 [Micromonospora sp. STR1_7]|uniref:Uncharacterized protein n=1 Tax=Micromonospora parastrephiae TaxID=2806101 RepID=A0ABS1XW99_9ACTN|nr:hypothetical protein [Micromonospora parastrephiae]MBM0233550.1 hypothetical protein [Micromonospora parastrephiae]